jgi:threonine synthase
MSLKHEADLANLSVVADVHLMDMHPTYAAVQQWLNAGADYLALHWEAYRDKEQLKNILQFIVTHRVKAGIALRPDTDLGEVIAFIDANPAMVRLVNQAGVLPCVGGQALDFRILKNLRSLREFRQEAALTFDIMVDGGIEPEIAGPKCFQEGADILVAGTAFFGRGRRDVLTMQSALQALKLTPAAPEPDIYDIIADRIIQLRSTRSGKLWVSIEGYHGTGKTFTAQRISEKLLQRGITPLVVGLDLSWTDRSRRAAWKEEAEKRRLEGKDHNYFHALCQEPEPMHWRKAHSERMLALIDNCSSGTVDVPGCYEFNLMGDVQGTVSFRVVPDSVIIVEGVYVSEVNRHDWHLRIYIDVEPEKAKRVAMVRDKIKVRRPAEDTRVLYEEVYEQSYREYVAGHNPRVDADVVLSCREVSEDGWSWRPVIAEARAPLLLLRCTNPDCREQTRVGRLNGCCHCGHDLRNEVVGSVDFLESIDESYQNMWRYHALLPVRPENIVTEQEGLTPVHYMEKTSRLLGIDLWTKMELVNPTGTFKDREASYVLSCSRQFGGTNLVMQSTGNTAIAIAHYAGVAGIKAWCFIPKSSSYKLWMPRKTEFGRIVAVDGHPIDVKAVAEDFAACFGFPKISPFYERCEANKTMAFEVLEEFLKSRLPEQDRLCNRNFDFYAQTLSAGMGLIGFHAAMEYGERWTRGRIRPPRMVAIEISEFAPIQRAWESGLDSVGDEVATPFFPDHPLFEPTLWTTNIAKYYPHLRRMLLASKGILASVTPDAVRAMVEKYGIAEEVSALGYNLAPTENASFIGFAGLAQKVESGEIPKGSRVILMLTGKGQKNSFVLERPDITVNPRIHKPYDILRCLQTA